MQFKDCVIHVLLVQVGEILFTVRGGIFLLFFFTKLLPAQPAH